MRDIEKTELGFTLLELLIVIAILGLLASVVMVQFPEAQRRARIAQAWSFSDGLRGALQMDMVGWWSLDGDAKDRWTDQKHGTVYGNPVWTEGIVNGALDFDGSGDYIVHPTPDINPRRGTLEAWVKPDVAYPWGLWQTHDSFSQNWYDWIAMFMWYGTFYFRMGNGSSCCANDVTFPSSIIVVGEWSHLVFTWGGTTMKAYVNGKIVAQRTNAIFQSIVDPKSRIGCGHGRMMVGAIDEVRIYEEALPSSAIQQHYAEGLEQHNSLAAK